VCQAEAQVANVEADVRVAAAVLPGDPAIDLPERRWLETFWPQAVALVEWGVAILGLAILRSTKRSA
jgi:hypothetical protein